MTTTAGPSDADGAQDLENRLLQIVGVIQDLAALRFESRATVGTAGDIVDAVAAGVNALGEELAASYEEIERRVADRTAELAVATSELRHRALHDDLTGLANRAAFWDRLAVRLDQGDRHGSGFAVLFLDLDDFKTVNDTLSHAAGDQLLVDVARRLTGELRSGDLAARVGGDEFVVLLDDVAAADAALGVAHRIEAALRAPHEFAGHRYTATSSIGVALGPGGFATSDAILAAADAAMYDAKRTGARVCVADDGDRPNPAGLTRTP